MHNVKEISTAPVYVWVLLIVMAAVSFWCQATVTEERFVPALNIIANEYNIPDDIAGATLMAAGASSPELFSSIVALFITHSALGLGTIVGSEIFNQLIICAGAVYAARRGKLQLDRAIVSREVGFYALSIIFLYIALHDRRPVDDDEVGEDHIFISFGDACLLFGGYIAYVAVCAYMDTIVAFFSGKKQQTVDTEEKKNLYGSIEEKRGSFNLPEMPFLREAFTVEPASNFSQKEKVTLGRTPTGEELRESSREGSFGSSIRSSLRRFSDGNSVRHFLFVIDSEKPTDEHGIHDIEYNALEDRMSCFLWQRSFFYNKARYGKHAWHLRWFSFTQDQIRSVPNRQNYAKHAMKYPMFTEYEFDDERLIIRIPNKKTSKRKDFFWMAPSKEVFSSVVQKMDKLVKHWEQETAEGEAPGGIGTLEAGVEEEFDGSDPHVDLTEFPSGGSTLQIFFFVFLYPLRWLMQLTIIDVRRMDEDGNPTASLKNAYLAIFMCLVWLIIGSYAMVSSLEHLAALMNIPDAVIGVTVSAAGTSLPNYVASKVAAQNGFGNMAVSNAFGSNTFNIMVGLGLPWLLYIATTGFRPYHALHDDGITMSVIILGTVLSIFVVLVVPTGFILYRWHGVLFVLLYITYLVYAIGQVYW